MQILSELKLEIKWSPKYLQSDGREWKIDVN